MINQQANTCVFYDGACPICRREISHYKKLLIKNQQKHDIDWIDISKSTVELKKEGIKYEDAMKLIHIRDESGVHQVGIDGIFTLWEKLPYYRGLSWLLQKLPFSHALLSRVYEFVAKHRMKLTGRL